MERLAPRAQPSFSRETVAQVHADVALVVQEACPALPTPWQDLPLAHVLQALARPGLARHCHVLAALQAHFQGLEVRLVKCALATPRL